MLKLIFRAIFAIALLSAFASAQSTTTVTGVIRDLSQAVVTSGQVTFELRPSLDSTISGFARFFPSTITCSINQATAGASGAVRATNSVTISGLTGHTFVANDVITVTGMTDSTFNGTFTIGSTTATSITYPQTAGNATTGSGVIAALRSTPGPGSCTVTMNTALNPSGSSYRVCIQPNFISPGSCFNDYAVTATKDLTTVVPTPTTSPAFTFVDLHSSQTIDGNKTFTGNTSFTGSLSLGALSVGGALGAQSVNNIQTVNSLTVGTDICAKIATGCSLLPSSGGTVDARFFQGTQACASNPLASCSNPVNILLGDVTIQSSVQWLGSTEKLRIIGSGQGQTILQYTGGTIASFVKLGTATPTTNQLFSMALQDMTIKGSANVTDTVFITGVHHSLFRNLDLKDASQACFHSQFAVAPKLENLRCSLNSGAFVQQPANGILLGSIDTSHLSTSGTVTAPIIEGVSGSGIKLDGAEGFVVTGGTSEQNNRGIEVTGNAGNIRNTFIGLDLEGNTTEDILDNGQNTTYIGNYALKLAHIGATAVNTAIKYGDYNSIEVDSGALKAKIEDIYFNSGLTGTLTDNAQETEWRNVVNAATNVPTPVPGPTGWFFRHVIPQVATASLGTIDRQDMIRGTFDIPTTGKIISTSASGTTPWRVLFIGAWMNNFEGAGLVQPAFITECTTASPTIVVGSTTTVTCSKNGSNQLVLTTGANTATFTGTIFVTTMTIGVAGTSSAAFKGSVTAAGLPQVIGSGTASMTTAGITTGACGTTVTVGATGVLTTDPINISHNAAVTIGNGGGLTLNAWPTAGNVNFNYCNSSAGTITPTAMTVNWSVLR